MGSNIVYLNYRFKGNSLQKRNAKSVMDVKIRINHETHMIDQNTNTYEYNLFSIICGSI
jgi:hypothetical protein